MTSEIMARLFMENTWWSHTGQKMEGDFLSKTVLNGESPQECRIQAIREYLLNKDNSNLSIERARLVTEAAKLYEGEPPVMWRAKIFAYVVERISIPLIEDQLLMGSPCSRFGDIEIDPEYYAGWLLSTVPGKNVTQLRYLNEREKSRVRVAPEVLRELEEEILPYWKEKHVGARINSDLINFYPDTSYYIKNGSVFMANYGKGFSHTILDYRSVVEKGLIGIKSEIDESVNQIRSGFKSQLDLSRLHHFQAMKVVADAMITYAKRCSGICESAAKSSDSTRAKELNHIASICRNVPEYPSKSWWEALQAVHLSHVGVFLCDGGVSHSFGRMDVWLYPYYKKWVLDGEMPLEQAQELLECFFLKRYEYKSVRDEKSGRGLAGDRTNDKITIGGMDRNGKDVTNELSYRLLEAHAHVHLKEPNLSARLHQNTPDEFLKACLEVVRLGSGLPQFINDEVIIPALVGSANVDAMDAHDYADIGCQENSIDPNSALGADANGHNNSGFFNLVKVFELMMYSGKNPLNEIQVGPTTEEFEDIYDKEGLKKAFLSQLRYAILMNVIMNHVVEYHFSVTFPNPYLNLMHPGTRKSGVDYVAGGTKYNWIGAVGVGLATVADCLMAVEELVFNLKICDMKTLKLAMTNSWKGYEYLRGKILSLKHYGADGKLAESWAGWVVDEFSREYEKHGILRGNGKEHFNVGFFSMGIYTVLGEDVGATPDGRFAMEELSGSIAPSKYSENIGYTASHNAAASINTRKTPNGIVFNQVISHTTVQSSRDVVKWGLLIKTYFEKGGMSVQYSVLNKEDLIAAQKEPEKYRDLIVRIGGYSAKFVDLTTGMQNEFIARLC